MKFSRILTSRLVLVGLGLVPVHSGALAQAQTLTWNGGNGTLGPMDGSGSWNYSGTNWWNGAAGASFADGNDVIFGAGAGNGSAGTATITAVTPVSPNSITFAPTGNGGAYSITGGSISVAGNGSGSLPITVNNNATVASQLTGAGGLAVGGSGLLSLWAFNSYSGPTAISAGTVQIVNFAAGAVAHYPFESNVNDNNGFGNNGTAVGGPTFTGGKFGQAITFNGSTQGVTVPYSSTLPTTAYTVSFWENVSSFTNSGNPTLFSTRTNGDNTFDIQLTSTGGLHGDYGAGNGNWINISVNSNGNPITLNTWNMVTFTVNSAGSAIYVNGVLNKSYANAGTPAFMRTSSIMTIGEQGAGTFLQGSMDELSIYNSVLSQAQITTLYNGQVGQLPSTPALVANGAAFDLHGESQSLASLSDLSGAGGTVTSSIAGVSTVTLTLTPSASTTYSGVIQNGGGTLALTLNGAGTQVLAGSSTYTGATTISAGTLQIGNGGNTGALGSRIVNNSTLVFNRSDAGFTVANAISGSGAVYFNGSGVTTLTGNSSLSGLATVSAGTLQVGNGGYTTAGIVNNSTLTYNTAVGQAYLGVISGSGAVNKTGAGTLVLSGTNTYTGATNINGGTVRLAPIAVVTPGSSLYLNAASVGGIANGGTVTAVQDLTGNGNNTTAGAGTVTYSSTGLGGNPTLVFNGGSNLNDALSASGNTGTIFVVMQPTSLSQGANGGSLFGSSANGGIEVRQSNTGGNMQLLKQNQIDLGNTSSSPITTSSQVVAVTFNQSAGGAIQFYVNGVAQSTGQNTSGFNAGFTAVIGGASNGDDFNGNISAVVAYTSVLTSGQIAATTTALTNEFFGTPANYAVLPGATDLNINASGAALDLSSMNQSVASLSGVAGSLVYLGSGALSVGSDGLTTTFAGNISDSGGVSLGTGGSLTKNGTGMLTLAGLNTYSGATNISGGTLQLGLGSAAGALGGGNYSAAISNSGVLAVNTSSNQTFGGAISGPGSLLQLGSGTVTLAANNSYAGGTFINNGALVVGNGATAGAILSAGSNTISNNGMLASNRSDSVTWSTAISGSGSVFQLGSGSLTLGGGNSYSGVTSVNAGTLILSNAGSNNLAASPLVNVNPAAALDVTGLAGGSGITLAGGQTLRGSGTVLGAVAAPSGATVLSGTGVAAGTGIGTLTISNNLTLASGATVAAYLGTPGGGTASLGSAGLIDVQGSLTLPASGLNLSLLNNSGAGGLGSAGNGFYELFAYSGSLFGSPSSALPATIGAKQFTYYNPSGQVDVQVSILALNWTGTAGSSWDTLGSSNWANGATAASYLDGANVTFSDTNSVTGGTVSNSAVQIQAGGVQPNLVTFDNNAVTYTVGNSSGTAGIAGTTGIVLSGSGTVNLQSPNSFQGQVAINAGILNITNSAALGNSSGVVVASGGALQMQGNISLAAPLSLSGGGFAASPAGALNSVSGTNSYSGPITLGGPGTITATAGQLTLAGGENTAGNVLTIAGSGNTTISTLGVSGSGGLTVAGPGTTTLAVASNFSGLTSVTGGVLTIPASVALGATVGANVSNGATLNLAGSLPSTANLVANGTVNITSASQTLATLSDSGAGVRSVTLNNTALTLTGISLFSGSITGGGSLTLRSGSLTLSGNSSLPTVNVNGGALTVAGGSVVAQTTFNPSTGTNTINLSGGVLQTPAWTSSVIGANTTVNFNGGTLRANAASANFLGATPTSGLALNVNINAGGAVIDTQANNIGIVQPFAGAGGLIKQGTGQLILGAANGYNGPTLVNAGVLQLGGPNPVLPAAPVARYPLDGNTNDASGNGLNATFQNGPASYTTGYFAQGLTFNGSSQYLTVPYNPALNLTAYTVSMWVNPAALNNTSPALLSTRNGGEHTLDLQYNAATGGLHGDIGNGGAWISTNVNYTLPSPIAVGTWDMVTLTVNSSGYQYYVNGIAATSGSRSFGGGTPQFMIPGETLSLGAQAGGANLPSNNGGYLAGSLDEANIYSGALTAAQVQTLYQGQVGQLPTATPLAVNSGATFDLNGQSQQVASLSDGIGGGGLVTNSASGSSVTLTLNPSMATNTFSGSIANGAGTVSLTLNGDGNSTQVLSGVNTFSGSAYVGNAMLVLANSGALLNATVSAAFGGGGIIFDQSVASHAFTFGGLTGSFVLGISDDNGNPVYLTVGGNNQSTTFNGTIDDAGAVGSLTKVGSGTLTLGSGPNTYSGGTFINGGVLSLNHPQAMPSGGAITFAGGVLQYTSNNQVDYSTQIVNSTSPVALDTNGQFVTLNGGLDASNTAGLTKLGSGTLAMFGTNSFGGPLYINVGVVNINSAAALPGGDNITFGGGVLQYTSSNTSDYSSVIKNSTGPIAVDTNGQNVTFASVLDASNSGGLTKLSAGALVLCASNAYSGTTTVAAGLLQLQNQAGVPDNTALAVSGGTFDLNGYSKSLNIVSGNALSGGLITSSAPAAAVTLNLSVGSGTAAIESVVGTTFSDGSGTLALTVSSTNGSGLQITSTNAFSGGTTISNGYVRLGNQSALGTGTITISNSGFVELWYTGSGAITNNFVLNTLGGHQAAGSQTGTKTAIYGDGAGGGSNYTLTGSIVLAANAGVDGYGGVNPNGILIAGPISGSGGLFKGMANSDGSNVVTLTNTANSYQGGTFINDGRLAITADAVLGSGNVTFVGPSYLQAGITGGTPAINIVLNPNRLITIATTLAEIDVQNNTMTIPGTISGSGALITSGGPAGLLVFSGSNTYGGPTYVYGGTLNLANTAAIPAGGNITFGAGVLQYSPSNTVDYSSRIVNSTGPISIDTNGQNVSFASSLPASNGASLNKLGAGNLTLTASNAFGGGTTVSGGTLQLGDGVANNGSVPGNIVNNSALVFANPASQTYGGVISGSGSLTKNAAGTLQLTANHTYSGPTIINAGTLQLGPVVISGFGANTSGVGSNSTWTINSTTITSAAVTGGSLELTDGANSEARSAFNNVKVSTRGFTASFVYTPSSGNLAFMADGVTFVLQNVGTGALAAAGGGLGYSGANNSVGINPSAAVQLNVFPNATGGVGTAFTSGGTVASNNSTSPVSLISGDPIDVTLAYNGSTLTESLTDAVSLATYSTTYAANLPAITGGSTAYVGFTGATGGVTATQVISNFNMSALNANVLPSATALSLSNSGILDLFGTTQQVASLSGAGAIINSNSLVPVTLTVGDPSNQNSSFSGTISDTGLAGAISLATAGTGTFVMSGSNTYSGATTINGGTLQLGTGQSGQDGSIGDTSGVVNNGALVYNLFGYENASYGISGSGSLTLLGPGSGTLELSGTNTYMGGTSVDAGTLIVDSPTALPNGSSLTVGQDASSIFAPVAGPAVAGGVTAVPEPGTLMLLLAGLVAGFGVWRRRR